MKATIWTQDGLSDRSFRDCVSQRLWPMDGDLLCAEARRRTKLEDFGDPPVKQPLSMLVNSLERETELHPFGRFLMWSHLRELLETRLQLTQAWNGKWDAIQASPIRRPIFITGMPRSGSTFLHELMAEDPCHRVPRFWEISFPVPCGEIASQAGERLWKWKAATRLWWFRRFAPKADLVHPLRSNTAHECVAIHSYTLLSEEFASSCLIPGYEAFLRSTDLRPVYHWQRSFLQYLQLCRTPKRWVLKSPDHVYGLEALFSAFPDALIIQTHRNPLQVLRSSLQLLKVLHGLFARPGDPDRLAEREVRLLSAAMDRALTFRDAHPELADRFVDVNYCELAADPMKTVNRIYRQLGIPLSAEAVERMQRLAANRSRYGGRSKVPTLIDAGVDTSAVANRFGRYCFRFGIPCEGA